MKKLVSIFLVSILAVSLFTGCNKNNANETTPTEKETTGETKTEEAKDPTDATPAIVTILIKDVSPTEEDVVLLEKKIEEGMAKNGQIVDIQFMESPVGAYKEAVPLAIRTGQISPDLIYLQGGDDALVSEGILEDLTPYIEKSTYIKDLMQDHNKKRMANYPYLLWLAPARVLTPSIRSDYFDKLEIKDAFLADPNVENYEKLFKELKDKGLTTYGISSDGSTSRIDTVFNHAFGVKTTFVKENDKWISSKVTQAEKDKLAFYNKLYTEGLLDPEYLTNAWDVLEQKFYEGKVAVQAGGAGGVIKIYNDKMTGTNGADSELIILPPAKGVSQSYTSIDNTKESRGIAIHADSEVKEMAFAVLDFMASPEGRMLDKLGIEGVHYNIVDGKIEVTDKFPTWWSRFWDTLYKFEPKMEFVSNPFPKPVYDSLDAIEKYAYEDINTLIPEELAANWDAMNTLYNEFSADIIRGVKPISDFDNFVTEWNKAGGDKVSEYLATVLK